MLRKKCVSLNKLGGAGFLLEGLPMNHRRFPL